MRLILKILFVVSLVALMVYLVMFIFTNDLFNSEENSIQIKDMLKSIVKLYLRIIGLHSINNPNRKKKEVYILGYKFRLQEYNSIFGSVSYIILEEPLKQFIARESSILSKKFINIEDGVHIIIALNWYNLQSFSDAVLGIKLLKIYGEDNNETKFFSTAYQKIADELYKEISIRKNILECVEKYNNHFITFTGFSMGGCYASIINFNFINEFMLYANSRCIGIGNNRPGSKLYNEWFSIFTNKMSFYVLLKLGCNIDPIAKIPYFFPIHPHCYIIENGKLHLLNKEDEKIINSNADSHATNMLRPTHILGNRLHSIKVYYENLL